MDDLREQAGRFLNLQRRTTREETGLAWCVWQAPGVWDFLSLPSDASPVDVGAKSSWAHFLFLGIDFLRYLPLPSNLSALFLFPFS